jgi:hypothetical protein
VGEQLHLFWGEQVVGVSLARVLLLPLLLLLLLWVYTIAERWGL